MRIIKDYRAITNGKYRLVCNVLIPIILGVILALIDIGVRKYYVTAVMLGVGAALMTAIEVMADYWGFGAICVKGCLGMDYLKTSTKGKAMLRNALTADLLVRPARIAICMVIVAVPYEIMVGNPVRLLCLPDDNIHECIGLCAVKRDEEKTGGGNASDRQHSCVSCTFHNTCCGEIYTYQNVSGEYRKLSGYIVYDHIYIVRSYDILRCMLQIFCGKLYCVYVGDNNLHVDNQFLAVSPSYIRGYKPWACKTCCPWICGHPFGWCYRVFDQFTSLQKTVVRVCNERTQQEHEVNENTTKLNKIDGTEPVADCAGLPKRGRSQQKICNRLYCYYQVSGI